MWWSFALQQQFIKKTALLAARYKIFDHLIIVQRKDGIKNQWKT